MSRCRVSTAEAAAAAAAPAARDSRASGGEGAWCGWIDCTHLWGVPQATVGAARDSVHLVDARHRR